MPKIENETSSVTIDGHSYSKNHLNYFIDSESTFFVYWGQQPQRILYKGSFDQWTDLNDAAYGSIALLKADLDVFLFEYVLDFQLEVALGKIKGVAIHHKYGRNPVIDTGTDPEDIWNGGSEYTGFPTGAAETMEIFSSHANDTALGSGARTVTIYNLLDTTGAEMPDITVSLSGVTPVSLGAGLYYRGGSRMKVRTAGTTGWNEGTLTLRHTATTANIFAVMPINRNQTAIAAYTVPLGKTLYISHVVFTMSRASNGVGSASMTLRERSNGEVFRAVINPEVTNNSPYDFDGEKLKFIARTDIKARVESVSNSGTVATAEWSGLLVDDV
jgi:hypothetical protein